MKVLKNYIYNTGYQLLAIILPLITSPYVSRRLLPVGIGIYSYTYSIVQYFVLFAGLGTYLYGSREVAYVRNDRDRLSKLFWEIIIIEFITVIISLIIYFCFCILYKKFFIYFLLQSFYIIAVFFDISWFFTGLEDFKKIVIRNSLVKVVTVILIFTFIKTPSDTGKYILILSLGTLIGNLTFWPYLKKVINWYALTKLAPFKLLPSLLALFIPQIAIQVYTQINKTLLGLLGNAEAAGFYNYSDSIIRMSLTLITSVSAVMLPHISNAFSRGEKVDEMTIKSFDIVSFLAFGLAFGLAAISLKFGSFFYGKDFAPVGRAMLEESIVVIPISWASIIGNQFLVATKKMSCYTRSVLLGAAFNIIIGIPLIIIWKLDGAMIATVLSESIVTGYQLISVKAFLSLKKLFKNIPKYIISGFSMYIVVFIAVSAVKMNLISLFINILIGIIIYLGVSYLLKPTIIVYIQKIKKLSGNL